MAARDHRAGYERRMHKVLEHIDRHLDQPLALPELAQVAHFSAFHFHRLFTAWMGETLGDYLRRRRLELGAQRLAVHPGEPVLNVALAVGFGSAEAFTRAFKARFGCPPTAWRAQDAQRHAAGKGAKSNPGQANRNPGQAGAPARRDHADSTATEKPMNVTVVDRAPVRIAYMRYTGPYGPAVSAFWQQIFAPWMAEHGLIGAARYGIGHDDPAITAPEQCRYDACVEIPANFGNPGRALVTTLPGGKYACTRYYGSGADIGDAWAAMLRDWLPASGMQVESKPFFEHYPVGARYEPKTGAFECNLCIPVADA